MRTPEAHEKHDVREYLRSIGAYFISPTTFGMGISTNDIVVCLPPDGSFWLLEVKREGGKPTVRQQKTAADVERANGCVVAGTAEWIIDNLKAYRAGISREKGTMPYD